jgi:phosphoribosylaminoimidazole-succinocarboxamide synthase
MRQRVASLLHTKFEFGIDQNGQLFLIDEVLTPDSSRFCPAPILPPEIVDKTAAKYRELISSGQK